jgi:hypothetical protein
VGQPRCLPAAHGVRQDRSLPTTHGVGQARRLPAAHDAYAQKSQLWIPTRVCQGRIITVDLPTLGTNPNSKQHGSATQEVSDLGNLQCQGRTIYMDQVDCSQGPGGLSAGSLRTIRKTSRTTNTTHRKWTVCALLADRSHRRGRPHSPCRPSTKLRATKITGPNGSKHELARTREEHDEQQICQLLADPSSALDGLSSRHGNSSLSPTLRRSTPTSLCTISQISQGIAIKS